MSDEVTRQAAEIRAERDNWQQRAEVLESSAHRVAAELTAERDAARADNIRLTDLCNNWQNQCQLHYNNLQRMLRKTDVLVAERDAAQNETHELRKQYAKLYAEAEGLRADLLAHPPETHTELAAERQRHLELMEDYDRREVVITTLEEALKRTENALKVAQGRHIDERLKGFLAVISQLADQSQDLLP